MLVILGQRGNDHICIDYNKLVPHSSALGARGVESGICSFERDLPTAGADQEGSAANELAWWRRGGRGVCAQSFLNHLRCRHAGSASQSRSTLARVIRPDIELRGSAAHWRNIAQGRAFVSPSFISG